MILQMIICFIYDLFLSTFMEFRKICGKMSNLFKMFIDLLKLCIFVVFCYLQWVIIMDDVFCALFFYCINFLGGYVFYLNF